MSPKNDYIDLHILPHNTRLEFIENLCGSFMDNVTARGSGELRLFGPLSTINLTGEIVANGDMNITTLNTVYTLHNDTVRFIPDEIIFENDTIYDQEGHYGIFSGSLYHDALTNLRYNLNVDEEPSAAARSLSLGGMNAPALCIILLLIFACAAELIKRSKRNIK